MRPHPVPELIRRRQVPGDRLGIGERGLLPVGVARRGLEVQQLVVLALGEACGCGRGRALVTAVLTLDRAGDVDPAQLLDLVVAHALTEDDVPRPREEPEAGGDVGPDRGAFRPRCALARAPLHLGPHLVVHLVQGHVADALLVRHGASSTPAASCLGACHRPESSAVARFGDIGHAGPYCRPCPCANRWSIRRGPTQVTPWRRDRPRRSLRQEQASVHPPPSRARRPCQPTKWPAPRKGKPVTVTVVTGPAPGRYPGCSTSLSPRVTFSGWIENSRTNPDTDQRPSMTSFAVFRSKLVGSRQSLIAWIFL